MTARGVGESRIAGVVYALKSLLGYARDVLKISVLDLTKVKAPRTPRREVLFLTAEELEQFVDAIPLRKWTGQSRLSGYRLRALVETLAATAMRI
jgi:integrase